MAAPLHPGGWCLRSGSRGVGQGPCSGHNLPSLSSPMSSPGRGQRAGSRVSPPCPHLAGERGQGAGSSLSVLTRQGAGSPLLSSPGRGKGAGGRVFPPCPHLAGDRGQGAEGRGQGLPSFPHLAGSTLWVCLTRDLVPLGSPPSASASHWE